MEVGTKLTVAMSQKVSMPVNKHWEYFQSHIASIMDCSNEDLQLGWKLSTEKGGKPHNLEEKSKYRKMQANILDAF